MEGKVDYEHDSPGPELLRDDGPRGAGDEERAVPGDGLSGLRGERGEGRGHSYRTRDRPPNSIIEDIIRRNAPRFQEEGEFSLDDYVGWMLNQEGAEITSTTARRHLMAAVESGELETRIVKHGRTEMRVWRVV